MADTAFQTQFRQEAIAVFESSKSLVTQSVTTEAVIKGNTATFLVAGSGGASAVTRGVNGMIPARADSLTQTSATLTEQHDLVRKTGFNVFASQGDQRSIMQRTSAAVINRKRDNDIITVLNTGTQDSGATATANLNMVLRAKTVLGNNEVPFDGNITGLISPAFEAYLLQTAEFASADYVGGKPMEGGTAWSDTPGFYRWLGINWIVHPKIPGVGTSAEKCFLYHKSAIGQAADTRGMTAMAGYDEEQDYSWARTSIFMGSVLLQNSGVFVFNHDGSAYIAE